MSASAHQGAPGSTSAVTRWLAGAHPAVFSIFAICGAFSTYFCMYAFRKPFAAGTFEGTVDLPVVGALDYKILLIISQVMGYCLSKFMGIKIISELSASKRAAAIGLLIAVAWGALALFALTPKPYNAVWLFVNGLPLGMIWGLVFGFLEGRRLTELLGAGLSASYIVASGFVKSVGRMVMEAGVSEFWMPFATGAIFVLPMVFFVWMLRSLPPPDAADIAARTERLPMDGPARKAFFWAFAPGLIPLVLLYIMLTAFRDFRDNYAVELWAALGYDDTPEILTVSELPIAFGVMVALALIMLVKNNRWGLVVVHLVMGAGTLLIGLSTLALQAELLDPALWMVLVGLGLYLAYVPYGCVLFDRLIAAVHQVATAGFLIYVTDAFGYAGSVALLLYKNFGQAELSWLQFMVGASYATAALCSLAFLVSGIYFWRRTAGLE